MYHIAYAPMQVRGTGPCEAEAIPQRFIVGSNSIVLRTMVAVPFNNYIAGDGKAPAVFLPPSSSPVPSLSFLAPRYRSLRPPRNMAPALNLAFSDDLISTDVRRALPAGLQVRRQVHASFAAP